MEGLIAGLEMEEFTKRNVISELLLSKKICFKSMDKFIAKHTKTFKRCVHDSK